MKSDSKRKKSEAT
jgi:hypothetical protein